MGFVAFNGRSSDFNELNASFSDDGILLKMTRATLLVLLAAIIACVHCATPQKPVWPTQFDVAFGKVICRDR